MTDEKRPWGCQIHRFLGKAIASVAVCGTGSFFAWIGHFKIGVFIILGGLLEVWAGE